jgi:hypothetical protein
MKGGHFCMEFVDEKPTILEKKKKKKKKGRRGYQK